MPTWSATFDHFVASYPLSPKAWTAASRIALRLERRPSTGSSGATRGQLAGSGSGAGAFAVRFELGLAGMDGLLGRCSTASVVESKSTRAAPRVKAKARHDLSAPSL